MSIDKLLGTAPEVDRGQEPTVLVIDDDHACLDEYAELIAGLGYPCMATTDSVLALQHISRNPQISIVLTDIDMPVLDGLSLMEEVSSRFMQRRPITVIAITGYPSVETAVSAMRSRAIDFLTKPVSRGQLAAALRRASQKIAFESDKARLQILSEIVNEHQPQPGARVGAKALHTDAQAPQTEDLLALVRGMIKSRQARFDYLNEELFSDPSWDILLELTSASLLGEPIPSSSACAAANAPMTTALRHINKLVDAGLVRRWSDPTHRRRVLLALTPSTFATMKSYLIAMAKRQSDSWQVSND